MSKLFNSILQGFKEFGEITNNKSLLNQIDEIETSETFEEDTMHKSIYTIDYVDNTGASFKDRIKASSEEDALKKFNKKSKNFVNGVRKIKGHPDIDYLDDDANYDEIDDLTEDTQLKFDDDMINDIDVLYGWRPQEVERILIKHGSKNNDNWIDGLDLPAAYDEIMSTFRDKYSDDDEIDYDAEFENALYLAEKRYARVKNEDPKKAYAKVANHLAYKGFNYDIIKSVLNKIFKSDDY